MIMVALSCLQLNGMEKKNRSTRETVTLTTFSVICELDTEMLMDSSSEKNVKGELKL